MIKQKQRGSKSGGMFKRRLQSFSRNRRGMISFYLFAFLFGLSLFSELIANDRPLIVSFEGKILFPAFREYSESCFGGFFQTEARYKDPFVRKLITDNGWMIWPPVRFSYDTINLEFQGPFPSPPSFENILGTDESGRDVFARILYGYRISVFFGLCLAAVSSVVGILVGAFLGYRGGWVDIAGQRFIEIWGGIPVTYILIILSSFVVPGFFMLLGIMLLFSWMGLVGVVRAEFLRCRNMEYVSAARVLGVSDWNIIIRHILPNAFVAAITYLPFVVNGSIISLSSLDFLGLGLPSGTPSLGDLLAQGKAYLSAPWIGLSAFAVLALQLVLLIFVGEGIRDAVDPYSEEIQ